MEAAHSGRRSLGDLFVERGLITETELEQALAEQAATRQRLADILVRRGLVTGRDITNALMDQLSSFEGPDRTEESIEPDPAPFEEAGPESWPDLVLVPGDATDDAMVESVDELFDFPADALTTGDDGDTARSEEDDPIELEEASNDPVDAQTLVDQANVRRHEAEAELGTLERAEEGLQRIYTELEHHDLASDKLVQELAETEARLRARKTELSAEITLWDQTREEAERAGQELTEVGDKLAHVMSELAEAKTTTAVWAARVADLQTDVETLTARADAAAGVLKGLATTWFADTPGEASASGEA